MRSRSSLFSSSFGIFSVVTGLVACSGSSSGVTPGGDGGTLPDGGGGSSSGGSSSGGTNLDGGGGGGQADGALPSAMLSAASVDFGGVDCGSAAPAAKTLTITNTGGQALTWNASLDATTVFSISGAAQGSIPAGGSAAISIAAKAVPASANAGDASSASLLVSTNDTAHASTFVPITMTADGATLTVLPSIADFGQVPLNTQAPDIAIGLKNKGNKPVSVTIGTPDDTDFTVTWTGAPAATAIAPGASLAGALARFKPTTAKKATATSALTFTGAVCGVTPATLPLKGEGTSGVAGVSPGTLDFGNVNCGATGAAQTVNIVNTGSLAFNYTATFAKGAATNYAVSAASGTVLAGQQAQLIVTPKAVPGSSAITANLYGDTLNVTTTASGDTAHAIDLRETAQGAIITANATSLAFAKRNVGSLATVPITFANAGNAPASLTFTTAAPFGAPGTTAVAAGGTAAPGFTYNPQASKLGMEVDATLAIASSDALCAPLPTTMAVSATAIDSVAVFGTGGFHDCVIGTSGVTYCWGDNQWGEVGDGTVVQKDTPTLVSTLPDAVALSSGYGTSCAIKKGGAVACWGDGQYGQLGNGTFLTANAPTAVSNILDASVISGGEFHVCAIRTGGAVSCWGNGLNGQLGNGAAANSNVAVTVSSITGATAIAGGGAHTCAIVGGAVRCWGLNTSGQLGNGTGTSSAIAVAVSGITDAIALQAGEYHTCALRAGGTVMCWGDGANGQLGSGTVDSGGVPVSSSVPVTVSGLTDAKEISSSSYSLCARRATGAIVCWGANLSGQIGNGTLVDARVPAATGITTGTMLGSGYAYACGVLTGGKLMCWGSNAEGEMGNTSVGANSLVPIAVQGFN